MCVVIGLCIFVVTASIVSFSVTTAASGNRERFLAFPKCTTPEIVNFNFAHDLVDLVGLDLKL